MHHLAEVFAGAEQLDHTLHPAQHHIGHHRLVQDVHGAQLIRLARNFGILCRRDQKHRQPRQQAPPVEVAQDLKAGHPGHHHIQQNGAVVLGRSKDLLQPRAAVRGLFRLTKGRKKLAEDRPVDGVVIHDQDSTGSIAVKWIYWLLFHLRDLLSGGLLGVPETCSL